MHFDTKSYLKSTRNHTVKHALSVVLSSFIFFYIFFKFYFKKLWKICVRLFISKYFVDVLTMQNYFGPSDGFVFFFINCYDKVIFKLSEYEKISKRWKLKKKLFFFTVVFNFFSFDHGPFFSFIISQTSKRK